MYQICVEYLRNFMSQICVENLRNFMSQISIENLRNFAIWSEKAKKMPHTGGNLGVY